MKELWFEPNRCFLANKWVAPESGKYLELINPSTGEVLCEIARGGEADVDKAVQLARSALDGEWGRLTAPERGRLLARLGQLVLENVDTLARLESLDVGKPLKQARADAVALARYMEFYAGAADKVHGSTYTLFIRLAFIAPIDLTGYKHDHRQDNEQTNASYQQGVAFQLDDDIDKAVKTSHRGKN